MKGQTNVISNIGGFFVIAIVLLVVSLCLSALASIRENVNSILGTINITENQTLNETTLVATAYEEGENLNGIVEDSFNFIVVCFLSLSIFSSFTQRNSIVSYFIFFILAVVATSFVNYVTVEFYNLFLTHTTDVIELTYFPSWFFDNVGIILFANVVAAGLSFLFIQRGGGVE